MSYHTGHNLVDPYQLFEKVQLHEGMHIADFGCGRTGHVVFPSSPIIGINGVVYAVDILKDVLESIRRRAAIEAIHNVETIWGNLEKAGGVLVAPKTLDVGFFVNVLFHFDNYEVPLNEAARILKEKGKIVVLDWVKKLSNLGPEDSEMVDFEKIKSWGLKNNFVVQEDFNISPYHRCLILYRHD